MAVASAHHSGGQLVHHHAHRASTGWVRSNDGATLTIRNARAKSESFQLTTTTKYRFANGSAATSSDAKPGAVVTVRSSAPTTTGGNRVADRVVIHLARESGLVQSNTGGVITIVDQQGFTRSIDTSGATCRQSHSTVACSSIAAESVVDAVGKVDSNGTTLDATRVRAIPPS
ncbi:MAG: hypothetical protein JOZ25_04225 [Actinobacteria bacterium]|nr:hypothetical protein [Actinomycetota bacterium]